MSSFVEKLSNVATPPNTKASEKKGVAMRATYTTVEENSWAEAQRVTVPLSKLCNSLDKTAIVNVFDCEMNVRAFSAKLGELVTKRFSVTEKVTKKGESYFRILLNPVYTDTSIPF